MGTRERFNELLRHKILISDGGMGTLLLGKGLAPGQPPELLLLEKPEAVESVHREYFNAGAGILTTNSFGGSRPKLANFGLADRLAEINSRAVEVARKVAGDAAFVGGSVGPTGVLLQPMGKMSPLELQTIFQEQVQVLASAGADFIIIETMGDIGEIQAAVKACQSVNVPFIASMTFDANLRSLSGSSPDVMAVTVEPFSPLAMGSNCGLGPKEMIRVTRQFSKTTHFPVIAQPNAGLPELVNGQTVFQMTPDMFAEQARNLAEAGAAIIGGCCGTTPDHIAATLKAVSRLIPQSGNVIPGVRFASRSKVVTAGAGNRLCIVGERINPTGRKKLSAQMAVHDFTLARRDARRQMEAGAGLLDLNAGVPRVNEPELMEKIIGEIQGFLPGIPLAIDSNDMDTLKAGLKVAYGRPLMNSINGEAERIETLLPAIRESGANFIALAMDESGIPEDADARLRIIRRIIAAAEKLGIQRNRILVDCLVFTVGSQPHQARETLKAITRTREELNCETILGVSNVSFGLPNRKVISSTFLAMAMQAGLSAAIINPMSNRMMETVHGAELLLSRDSGARQYVKFMEEQEKSAGESSRKPIIAVKKSVISKSAVTSDSSGDPLRRAVVDGDKAGIVGLLETAIDGGATPDNLLKNSLIPAIQEVGESYNSGVLYLPQLILAGETMRKAVRFLQPMLGSSTGELLHGTSVILGTVAGDIHDIGKNIVSIVLGNHGFSVLDLGKDVSTELFIETVKKCNARLVGLSALMTTTMPAMEETTKMLKAQFPDLKIMVGGAVVTRKFADIIGADGYAKDAVSAGDLAKRLAGLKPE